MSSFLLVVGVELADLGPEDWRGMEGGCCGSLGGTMRWLLGRGADGGAMGVAEGGILTASEGTSVGAYTCLLQVQGGIKMRCYDKQQQ